MRRDKLCKWESLIISELKAGKSKKVRSIVYRNLWVKCILIRLPPLTFKPAAPSPAVTIPGKSWYAKDVTLTHNHGRSLWLHRNLFKTWILELHVALTITLDDKLIELRDRFTQLNGKVPSERISNRYRFFCSLKIQTAHYISRESHSKRYSHSYLTYSLHPFWNVHGRKTDWLSVSSSRTCRYYCLCVEVRLPDLDAWITSACARWDTSLPLMWFLFRVLLYYPEWLFFRSNAGSFIINNFIR